MDIPLLRPHARKVYRVVKNLRELWGWAAFCLLVVTSPFGKPTLSVTYELLRLYPPITAESKVKDVPEKTNGDDGIRSSLAALVTSRDLLEITLQNNSSDPIDSLDIQIDAFTVGDVALHSDSSRVMSERQRIATMEVLDNCVARFPNLVSIPPKASITVMVWGDFTLPMLGSPVKVSAATKSIDMNRRGRVSGLGLDVARNLSMIIVFLAVGLLLVGLRRFR